MNCERFQENLSEYLDDALSPGQTSALLERLWNLEKVKDVGEVLRLTVI